MQVPAPRPGDSVERLARALDRAEAAAAAADARRERLEAAARAAVARIDRLLATPEDEADG